METIKSILLILFTSYHLNKLSIFEADAFIPISIILFAGFFYFKFYEAKRDEKNADIRKHSDSYKYSIFNH